MNFLSKKLTETSMFTSVFRYTQNFGKIINSVLVINKYFGTLFQEYFKYSVAVKIICSQKTFGEK